MTLLLPVALLVGLIFYSQQLVATATAISQGQQRGFGAALAVLSGALAGDAFWLAAALVVVAVSSQIEPLRIIFSIVGSFFFLRLAWGALMDARQGAVPHHDTPGVETGFQAGARISFRNPYALGFWVGAAMATILLVTTQPGLIDYVTFFVGVVSGAALWSGLIAWLTAQRRNWLSVSFFRAANIVCGIAAAILGVAILWATVAR